MKKRKYRKFNMRNFKRAEFCSSWTVVDKEVRYTDDLGAEYAVINPTVQIKRRSYANLWYSVVVLIILLAGSITLQMCDGKGGL